MVTGKSLERENEYKRKRLILPLILFHQKIHRENEIKSSYCPIVRPALNM